MPKRKRINPFYILLLLAGAAFAVTAVAYGVMTARSLQASRLHGFDLPNRPSIELADIENDRFGRFVDQYGSTIMIVELALLTIGTFGAIAYDQRLDRKEAEENPSTGNEEPPNGGVI